jgi:hypothetical protein
MPLLFLKSVLNKSVQSKYAGKMYSLLVLNKNPLLLLQ